MTHRNDDKLAKLNTDLGTTGGNISDRGYDWLILQGVQPGHINDMWKEFNQAQNTEANLNDSWFAWLGDLLHTGALADRWKAFWSS